MLFDKSTDLKITDADPASAMTLMSADIERIVTGWQGMHELWASMIEIALAIFLLEQQLGPACVVPIVVAICECTRIPLAMTQPDNEFSGNGRFDGCNKSCDIQAEGMA